MGVLPVWHQVITQTDTDTVNQDFLEHILMKFYLRFESFY